MASFSTATSSRLVLTVISESRFFLEDADIGIATGDVLEVELGSDVVICSFSAAASVRIVSSLVRVSSQDDLMRAISAFNAANSVSEIRTIPAGEKEPGVREGEPWFTIVCGMYIC